MNSRVVSDSVGSQGTCNAEQQFPWCSARCTAIQLQAVHSPWEIRFTSHLGPSSQGRWVLAPIFKSLGGPHSNHSQVYVWLVKPSHGELVPRFKACPATPSCFLSLFLVSSSAQATESRPEKGRQLREAFVGPGIVTSEETGHSLSGAKQPVYITEGRASERNSSTTLPGKVVPLWPCL